MFRTRCAVALVQRVSVVGPMYPPPARRRRSHRVWVVAVAASRQDQRTALHFAAFYGNATCAESLLKAGADASLKDLVRGSAVGA